MLLGFGNPEGPLASSRPHAPPQTSPHPSPVQIWRVSGLGPLASTLSDGRQHVKLLGTNTFGFEDLLASQDSDWTFNITKTRLNVA